MSSLLAVESGMGGQGLVGARVGNIPKDYHERLRADHGRVAVSSEEEDEAANHQDVALIQCTQISN